MATPEERVQLAAMLVRLVYCDEHPEEGPFYIHEVVKHEALLIKTLRGVLGEESKQ